MNHGRLFIYEYLDPGRYVSLGMPYGKQATNPGWGGITLRLRKVAVCLYGVHNGRLCM